MEAAAMPDPAKPVPPQDELKLGEPYCGACGHQLTGLVDSSKCPECGRPIVEVLTRAGKMGKRYRSKTMFFGLPLVSIAFGGTHDEPVGNARGVFAFGDNAKGIVAVGGKAKGVVAVGGTAYGLFAIGGIAIGLITAWGGVGIGAIASGGLVISLIGFGGACAGIIVSGGVSAGLFSYGGAAFGLPLLGTGDADTSQTLYRLLGWFFGPPSVGVRTFLQPTLFTLGVPIIVSAITGVLAWIRHMRIGGANAA
jgi:predicted RNA-binding Zn-ribbon protein involved in translation (DUF1610 family)